MLSLCGFCAVCMRGVRCLCDLGGFCKVFVRFLVRVVWCLCCFCAICERFLFSAVCAVVVRCAWGLCCFCAALYGFCAICCALFLRDFCDACVRMCGGSAFFVEFDGLCWLFCGFVWCVLLLFCFSAIFVRFVRFWCDVL